MEKTIANARRLFAMRLSRHYKRALLPEGTIAARDAAIVLADLRDYCRATTSTFDPDAMISARLQGRRDVWLRIAGMINLDEAQVHQLIEMEMSDAD